jgi:hypothetical protein
MDWVFEKYLKDPRSLAQRQKHDASIHRAVLVKRNKIIAEATNNYGSRSRGSGYDKASIHAEKNVIKSLGDVQKMRGADMYVMRFNRAGDVKLVNSTPCSRCFPFLAKCMKEYGLKRVYYTC